MGRPKGSGNKTEDSKRVHKRRYHPRVPKTLHGIPDPNFEAMWGEDGTEADKHYSRLIYAERMLTLGYRRPQVMEAIKKKYALSTDQANEIINQVQEEWTAYVKASDDERFIQLEARFDMVWRQAILSGKEDVANNILKTKMSFYGFDTKNLNIKKYDIKDVLDLDVLKDRTNLTLEKKVEVSDSDETDK